MQNEGQADCAVSTESCLPANPANIACLPNTLWGVLLCFMVVFQVTIMFIKTLLLPRFTGTNRMGLLQVNAFFQAQKAVLAFSGVAGSACSALLPVPCSL